MKINSLISDIRRGEWLIDTQNIEAYFPIVDKLLAGEQLNFNAEPKSIINFVTSQGDLVKPNEEGLIKIPKGSIAVVSMTGEIVKYGNWCIYGADEIVEALTLADRNKNVIATIFKIDGPGGGVNAIGPFRYFAEHVKTKPVIGLVDSALSLHYWTAIEVCDHIMTDNDVSARLGSVGVVLTFGDNKEALEKAGYKIHEIYPEESKFKNKAFQLAREGKYDMIKSEFLSPLALKFQERVKFCMPNIRHTEEGVITGKTFFAEHALDLNMIHSIGGMNKAIEKAIILSSIN